MGFRAEIDDRIEGKREVAVLLLAHTYYNGNEYNNVQKRAFGKEFR